MDMPQVTTDVIELPWDKETEQGKLWEHENVLIWEWEPTTLFFERRKGDWYILGDSHDGGFIHEGDAIDEVTLVKSDFTLIRRQGKLMANVCHLSQVECPECGTTVVLRDDYICIECRDATN